ILGEGYVIQKQDVLSKTVYNASESTGYLQKKYDAHFHGRTYTRLQTYLVITQKALNSVYSFSEKQLADFEKGLGKILDLFKGSGLKAKVLDKKCIRSEEHTSELQSREKLVCRRRHEKKKHGAL